MPFNTENMTVVRTLVVLVFMHAYIFAEELIQHGGFEEEGYTAFWECRGCSMTRVQDSHGGTYALKVENRVAEYAGPRQALSVTKNAFYEVESYVKLLNDEEGSVHTRVEVWRNIIFTDGTKRWHKIGNGPYLTTADGWKKVGGSFRAPDQDVEYFAIYFRGPDPAVSFLVDSVSIKLIPEMSDTWKDEAEEKIQQNRMADIILDTFIGDEYHLNDTEIQVQQESSEFPFGAMVKADLILGENEQKYRDFVSEMWDWTTISNAMKWRMMQWHKDSLDYETPTQTVAELLKMGKKIRGHNVVWGVEKNVPYWLKDMSAEEVKAEVDTRVKGVVSAFKGSLSHWDVNNEIIAGHGDWFEQNTGDRFLTETMFQNISAIDPDVKLFFNEFNVISSGTTTDAYVDMVELYKSKGLPLHGIGVQGHLKPGPPDILKIKENLDKLATTGLPVWITELDIEAADINDRGDYYEDVLTYLFSHPAVEGIMLWVWHDNGRPWREDTNLAAGLGDDFQVNEAGNRIQQLIKKTWRTKEVIKPTSQFSSLALRGFMGDYTIKVLHNGVAVLEKKVSVGKEGATVNLQAGSGLSCVSRWSAKSGIGNGETITVPCADGEIMTGCSSRAIDKSEYRDGERFGWNSSTKKRICKAINSAGSTASVQAIARCCKLPVDLQCSYPPAQASGTGENEQISIPCPTGKIPTGCTCLAYNMAFDGSFPDMSASSCVAQNDGIRGGSYGTGACCQASGLECVTKISERSGGNLGDKIFISCEAGYTITGCNVYNDFGGTAGAYTASWGGSEYCIALNGRRRTMSNQGVKAVATCCRIANTDAKN
ncbi:uncharacterized protein LOC106181603 [Lingula anatina]|uniref:Uncharacterized protein LOC106181603 n=1 Tax=Lingula anatina TaxID=7574 RepID=A0A1S3KG91_LINAN|nr:uncharacterized protein LOC106181603 [Lingula anatina]|eukprot:XP_013421507.1 uncharacterized protein LOC106181603 [Lingula anatina]